MRLQAALPPLLRRPHSICLLSQTATQQTAVLPMAQVSQTSASMVPLHRSRTRQLSALNPTPSQQQQAPRASRSAVQGLCDKGWHSQASPLCSPPQCSWTGGSRCKGQQACSCEHMGSKATPGCLQHSNQGTPCSRAPQYSRRPQAQQQAGSHACPCSPMHQKPKPQDCKQPITGQACSQGVCTGQGWQVRITSSKARMANLSAELQICVNLPDSFGKHPGDVSFQRSLPVVLSSTCCAPNPKPYPVSYAEHVLSRYQIWICFPRMSS